MWVKCTLFSGYAVFVEFVPVRGLIHGSDVKHRLAPPSRHRIPLRSMRSFTKCRQAPLMTPLAMG